MADPSRHRPDAGGQAGGALAGGSLAGGTLAGGMLLGAFGYASTGSAGWHVTQRVDSGGLTDAAVAEGARLIERVPWWPGEPLALGADPYQRPRRLAWLGSGTTPRRFLVHTIHAENDASNRPDNNYTECLVVSPPTTAPDPAPVPPPDDHTDVQPTPLQPRSPRPSQQWAVEGWATPWGAEAVAQAQPGLRWPGASRPVHEVVEVIVADSSGLLRLRSLLAAVHRALHLGGPSVVGVVDDLVWGAVLLDTALALLPPAAAWEVTFDLRSLPPAHRISTPWTQQAMVRLLSQEHRSSPVPQDALDLTAEATEETLEHTVRHSEDRGCPRCGQWHASIDRLLRMGEGVTPAMLDRQLTELAQGTMRAETLAAPRPGSAESPSGSEHRSDSDQGRPRDLGHPNLRPVDGWPERPLGGPVYHPFGSRAEPAPPAEHLPAVDEAIRMLQECRDQLAHVRSAPAPADLRRTWQRLGELAESELRRIEDVGPIATESPDWRGLGSDDAGPTSSESSGRHWIPGLRPQGRGTT